MQSEGVYIADKLEEIDISFLKMSAIKLASATDLEFKMILSSESRAQWSG